MSTSLVPQPPLAPFETEFEEAYKQESISLVSFLEARPPVCLKMMKDGWITDLNEKNQHGIPLLALRHKTGSKTPLPTWQEWEERGEEAWGAVQKLGTQHVAASMIFAGADPWVEFDPEKLDKTCNCFFSSMIYTLNTPMISLLLSHPQCPSAEYMDTLRLVKTGMKTECWHNSEPPDAPLIHYVANRAQPDLLKMLIAKGLNVNVLDPFGRNALFYVQDVESAKILMEAGTTVGIKDESGQSLNTFWKKTISTAAKQSEFNKLLIEKMKHTMTPDELRELQKPALFNEVLKGTKTSFEGIYKKAKFDASVSHTLNNSDVNLITAAILRKDEKTPLFVRWAEEKGVSWSHALWKDKPLLNNAMLSFVISQDGSLFPSAAQLLMETYQGPEGCEALYGDTLDMLKEMSVHGLQRQSVLRFMHGQVLYQEDLPKLLHQNAHQMRYNNLYNAAHQKNLSSCLAKWFPHTKADPALPAFPIDLFRHPRFHEVYQTALRQMVKVDMGQAKRPNTHHGSLLSKDVYDEMRKHLNAQIQQGSGEALTTLVWLLAVGYGSGFQEMGYDQKLGPNYQQRLDDLTLLDQKNGALALSEEDYEIILKGLGNMAETNARSPSLAHAVSSIGGWQIASSLTGPKTSATRRKM